MAHQTPAGSLRIGHAERDRTIALLREHTAAGRLDLDEFEERVGQVTTAKTAADLDAVLTDLPRLPSQVPPPRPWGPPPGPWGAPPGGWSRPGPWAPPGAPGVRTGWRVLPLWARLVLIMLVVWAVTGAGYFWPVWVIVPLAFMAVSGCHHRARHPRDFTA